MTAATVPPSVLLAMEALAAAPQSADSLMASLHLSYSEVQTILHDLVLMGLADQVGHLYLPAGRLLTYKHGG